jgi:hypothetical protein
MITITINKKRFKGVYSWDDVTLSQFCDLAAINMPEGYESFIIADGKFSTETLAEYIKAVSKITDKQLTNDFPAYYRKVIKCLSNIPERVIQSLPEDKVNDLYEYYFKPFVVSLLYNVPVIHFMGQITQYEPKKVSKFRIGLNTYYLPQSLELNGQSIPLANEPIISYSEASDIFRGMKVGRNDVKRLALFMAIYCRKKGEQYDERKALERQEQMMRCKMSVVWSVFFYTVQRVPGSSMIIQLFGKLPKQIREVRDRAMTYQNMEVEV